MNAQVDRFREGLDRFVNVEHEKAVAKVALVLLYLGFIDEVEVLFRLDLPVIHQALGERA